MRITFSFIVVAVVNQGQLSWGSRDGESNPKTTHHRHAGGGVLTRILRGANPMSNERVLQTGACGNGNVGNGMCADGNLCCSVWGWCGTSPAHCGGGSNPPPSPTPPTNPPPPPTPTTPTTPAPAPAPGPNTAYITYHNYYAGQSTNEVACSDGANGLATRWGYTTLDPMLPYVSATSISPWNSPNCGNCYRLEAGGDTVHVTTVDLCGAGPSGEMHFDMHPTSFQELLGQPGVNAGSGYATFTEVDSSNCQGNLGLV